MASSMTCTTGLHALHLRAAAVVLAPLTEERFLPLPQQFQAGQIDGLWVVRRIVDVIGPRPHLRKLAGGAGLELSVFQNGEIDAADDHPCEVDADVAVDGRGIGRIRQMPTLLPLHLIHIRDGIAIASVGIAFDVGLDHHRARERWCNWKSCKPRSKADAANCWNSALVSHETSTRCTPTEPTFTRRS